MVYLIVSGHFAYLISSRLLMIGFIYIYCLVYLPYCVRFTYVYCLLACVNLLFYAFGYLYYDSVFVIVYDCLLALNFCYFHILIFTLEIVLVYSLCESKQKKFHRLQFCKQNIILNGFVGCVSLLD